MTSLGDIRQILIGERGYPFLQAMNYTRLPNEVLRTLDLVVVHDMEIPELKDTAERCARYFADQPKQGSVVAGNLVFKSGSSAHYCVSVTAVVQCVRERDVAWHAPGANHNGIGVELAGKASQSPRDWVDAYSSEVLVNAANLIGAICETYDLPIAFVDDAGLLKGERGITTHACVSRAFHKSTHTDPGAGFPMDLLLDLTRAGAIASTDPG